MSGITPNELMELEDQNNPSVSKSALSGGLSNAMFLNGLLELWSHLKRATQLDIINRMRAQPKAILTPMQLQILEANLKTE